MAGDEAMGQRRSALKVYLQEGTQIAGPGTNPRSRWLGEKWKRPKEVPRRKVFIFRF